MYSITLLTSIYVFILSLKVSVFCSGPGYWSSIQFVASSSLFVYRYTMTFCVHFLKRQYTQPAFMLFVLTKILAVELLWITAHVRQLRCIRSYLDHKTASTIATSIVHSKLDHCNSLHYNLPNTQLNRLQYIQNSLARAVVRAPKSSRINPALRSLHWLTIKQCIDHKILSLAYKVRTTTQPSYLYNLISVQLHRSTRSSAVVTLLAHLPLPLWMSTTAFSVCTDHPVSGISFPRNFTCLLIMKTYHSHLISHTSVRHLLRHHCHHPLLLLSSTPGSKLIFSSYPFLHSSSTFPTSGLTPWTPAVLRFSPACRF